MTALAMPAGRQAATGHVPVGVGVGVGVGVAPTLLCAPAEPDTRTQAVGLGGTCGSDTACRRVGRAAVVALYDEVALYPKPGLVSFVDAGSHDDMTAATFLRSLFALRSCFLQMARLGSANVGFASLEGLGRHAERQMLRATGGINTHRGAIFLLGLLCAAAGRLAARGQPLAAGAIRQALRDHWGAALVERQAQARGSNGQRAARAHGLRSAGDEAALGFPVLFEVALPALQGALSAGLPARTARLQALLATMAVLDDTNLVHRGGLAGLHWARGRAVALLAAGGLHRPGALDDIESLHRQFVARRLSPGGSADVLAAACWLHRVGDEA